MRATINIFRILFLLPIVLLVLAGCAQISSQPKQSASNTLRFDVTFSSKYDAGNYRYFFIYSKKPISVPIMTKYLFVPGENSVYGNTQPTEIVTPGYTDTEKINYYYGAYFSSWANAFVLDNNIKFSGQLYYSYPYPQNNYFPITADSAIHDIQRYEPVNNDIAKWGGGSGEYSNGIYLEIALNRLTNAPAYGENIYFLFLTLDHSTLVIKDVIDSNSSILQNIVGKDTDAIYGIRDITKWRARIL